MYRVRDRWSGREVALKAAADPRDAEALVHEFRLLSRLRHPCLVESLDLLRDGDDTAHLLEYVPATDPRSLWSQGGEPAVWSALLQALRGLAFLHRHGYVHGDVAPGNILVWRDGGEWRSKVADLGLARTLEAAGAGGVRGTPGFLAPECARGEASGPAADLYSLAATALVWIDGHGGWDGLSGPEQVRRIATGAEVPRPRRRVSPELEGLLRSLGNPVAVERSPGRWGDHRARRDAWGPETLSAAIAGVDERLEEWTEWVESLPSGEVGSILIRGRTGSGRKTLARAMARSLVAAGWTAVWDLPLEAVRDWLDAAGEDPDPVRLARELDRRFAGRDIVLLWPNRRRDLESRLLRAFAARRADERKGVRTAILKWVSVVEDDPDDDWLRGSSRFLEEAWSGPDPGGLEAIREDLFPPEEGFDAERRPLLPAGSTPLSAILLKRAGGLDIVATDLGEGREAVKNEVQRIWERSSRPTRDALVILSWSDGPWELDGLRRLVGWDSAESAEASTGIATARLTRRSYEGDRARERLGDWMAREVLRELGESHFPPEAMDAMAHRLETDESFPLDLGLAGAVWETGHRSARYLTRAMESSLAEGKYEPVLEVGRWPGVADLGDPAVEIPIWERVLRAARRLGTYPEQVEALERLISLQAPETAVPNRKELAQAQASLGRWQECLEQCGLIERTAGSEADRLWARLQRAETFWQEGRFADADAEYERIEPVLQPPMKEEWLRYGVGRARQSGQRGGINAASRHLDEMRKRLGGEKCESDPMFLITLGAVTIRQGDFEQALEYLQRATRLSAESGSWVEYLRATTRVSNVFYGLGEVLRAAQTAAESFAVATAFGNDRLTAIVDSYLGHYEVDTGNLGSALRRARRLADVARTLGDENQVIQGQRLVARVGALAGWPGLMGDAVRLLRDQGKKLGIVGSQAHADFCEGVYLMGKQDWKEAEASMGKAERIYQRAGLTTEEVEARLYRLICQGRSGDGSAAVEQLDPRRVKAFPILLPIGQLARMEAEGTMLSSSAEDATKILRQLWDQGRVMDVIDWGPRMLLRDPGASRLEIKKRLIGAVQRAANSLDDPDLRTQFLSFPKTKLAMQVVVG